MKTLEAINHHEILLEILSANKAFKKRRSIYLASADDCYQLPDLQKEYKHKAVIANMCAERMITRYNNYLNNNPLTLKH